MPILGAGEQHKAATEKVMHSQPRGRVPANVPMNAALSRVAVQALLRRGLRALARQAHAGWSLRSRQEIGVGGEVSSVGEGMMELG